MAAGKVGDKKGGRITRKSEGGKLDVTISPPLRPAALADAKSWMCMECTGMTGYCPPEGVFTWAMGGNILQGDRIEDLVNAVICRLAPSYRSVATYMDAFCK